MSDSSEVRRLSDWLSPLQDILLRRGYRRSYIGGSSAREILDHVRLGTGISLRDLDVYLLRHGPARPEDIAVLCAEIEARGLAEASPLREKRRANPALRGESRYRYLAGYGVHLFSPGRPILSLGVLHRESDLALNGLFDIDTTYLVVGNDDSFRSYAGRVSRHRTAGGLVLDPHGGYPAWRRRSPRIVHWAEVERGFPHSAFRIVRSLAKASRLHLPEDLRDEYRRRRSAAVAAGDPVELRRDLLKVLGDEHWAEELCMLARLDALAPVSARLQARVGAATPAGLRRAVPCRPGAGPRELSCLRAAALCADPPLLRDLLSTAPLVFGAARC